MWIPPPDPDKPNCPYLPGFEVDISTHVAPLPFGGDYPAGSYPYRSEEWLESVSQTKHVVTFPPLETPAPAQPKTARLIVIKSLAIGNARGAQIVLCSVIPHGQEENASPFQAVAKIYDPLYYSFVTDIGHCPSDVVLRADSDYTQEAAAYEHLERAGQTGSFAPAYFGSWSFSLPISYNGGTHQRSIRLILIENLPGICMKDLFAKNGPYETDATHLSEDYRLSVLAMLLDGVAKQSHVGIYQRDLAPRNVFIIPSPMLTQESPRRVVLVNYSVSKVWELTKYGKSALQLARLPPNPMERFWNTCFDDLIGWAPTVLGLSNPRRFQEWLRHEFGGEKKALYEPVLEELEFYEPQVEEERPSSPMGLQKSQDEFQVVKAPAMLEGEKPAPTSSPLIELMKRNEQAFAMGQYQEKDY